MTEGLYRREVLERRQQEWLGAIRLCAPRLGWVFLTIALLTIAGTTVFLAFGEVTRYQRVEGSLVPSAGLLAVSYSEAGQVNRVLVQEGDLVGAEQPLLEISSETHSVTLGETHAAIGEQLAFKQGRLKEEISESNRAADLKRADLQARADLLLTQLSRIGQKLALQRERVKGASSLYEQWSRAESSGAVSKLQVLQQRDTALDYQAQVEDLEAQGAQVQQQFEELVAERNQLPFDTARKRSELQRQLADLKQASLQNEAARAVVIKSPSKGMVTSVLVHSGDGVSPQQVLVNVLPAGSLLLAELWVEPRAIGTIRAGEAVTIRYTSFPYQRFGQYGGRVQSLSRSAISAADVARIVGHTVDGPRYRVRVELDRQSVLIGSRQEPLIPGLTLEADIIFERQRIADWLFTTDGRGFSAEAANKRISNG